VNTVCSSQMGTGGTSSTTVIVYVHELELPQTSVAVHRTICVPTGRSSTRQLFPPKWTSTPADTEGTRLNGVPHASKAEGRIRLTSLLQNHGSVPMVWLGGHTRTGGWLSVSLITWTHSATSCAHQSSTVHLRIILVPLPQSVSS